MPQQRTIVKSLNRVTRMLKMAVQQGRSEQGGEAYSVLYVEPLSDARTPLADFFSILLDGRLVQTNGVEVVVQSGTLHQLRMGALFHQLPLV